MRNSRGFSLTEVLVVVSTVSVLMAISMPVMNKARAHARAIVCRSNLRQLVLANMGYANENDGFCVPAAEDYWLTIGPLQGGYHRWHGVRDGNDKPFDPLKGPLADYLADGEVKECPTRVDFTKNQPGIINFERGCGGYGYNMAYIGSRLARKGLNIQRMYAETPRMAEIKMPDETLMFADTAFYQKYQDARYLIEYSFAEPPFVVFGGKVYERTFTVPSIHFRHSCQRHSGSGGGSVNIGWADGHIEPKPMANLEGKNAYDAVSASVNIGWFEPVDNSLFDLK
jgi:prepilin-type N-terminal cleavage/methylation domain-containing protein/prepilin-type processing-associated H-X9-DG protein